MIAFLRRLKSLLPIHQRAQDYEIQEELAALEQFASRKELGNLTRAAEEARAEISFPLVQGLDADIRYAWRSLKRDKTFTAIALLSLSIGISANLAVFGLMDALLWRQLPIRKAEQLVSFENTSRSYFGYSQFAKYSDKALESVIAESPVMEVPVDTGSGAAVGRQIKFVSGNYFRVLSVTPELGRSIEPFDADRDHPSRAAMLSYSYWRHAFGENVDVAGRTLYIGKAKFQIIGVTPQDFFGLTVGEAPDVWLPLTAYPTVFPGSGTDWLSGKNNNWLDLFGRLRDGISLARAQAILSPVSVEIDMERNGIFSATEAERRAMLKDSIRLIPASKGISELRDRFSRPLHVVFGMLAIGLLLACINIVNLQIARSDESRREFSIRLAMGAGRFRVARQCLIEMLLLSIVSGCAGLVLFQPIATAVISIMTVWGNMPAHIPVRVDGNLFAFVLISSSAVAVFCGILPAIYATGESVHAGLQGGSASIAGHRGPRSLIRTVGVVQLAISLLMTTATCLFALNLGQLRRFDGGIKRNRLVEAELDPSAAGYSEAQAVRLDERLRTRIASIPGVEEVSYSEDGIYSGRNFSGTFEVDKSVPSVPESERYGIYDYVGPKFFTTLGTTLLAGRDFSERDTASAPPVVIINQALATRFFPDRNPIGRPFYVSDGKREKAYQIIGTVRDVKSDVRTVRLAWYFAAAQHQIHPFSTCFLIRTGQNRAEIVRAMRARIRNEDHKLEIANVQTANDLFDLTVQTDRLLAALGWVFGILAILLASAGIYGLLSYDVARRRGEIGIRTALGARRSDIAGLMLSQAGFIVVFGLALGGIAANLLTRLFGTLVFEMKASDPRIELVAGLVLVAVAMAAAWLPVRRAACVDPMRALRTE